jgi:hypothetical protein
MGYMGNQEYQAAEVSCMKEMKGLLATLLLALVLYVAWSCDFDPVNPVISLLAWPLNHSLSYLSFDFFPANSLVCLRYSHRTRCLFCEIEVD